VLYRDQVRVLDRDKAPEKEGGVIVEVVGGAEERPEVRIVDVDDLSRLHLALGEVTDDEADGALQGAGLGRLLDEGTGLLDTAALRAAAGALAHAPDWGERFDAMVDDARERGWVSDDGATLRVHVESAAGA
jgi:hypothetical protein